MKVFAHRGASGTQPENTLAAFQAAIDMQVDGIEVDVFEKEGQLLLIHDRWLERTTSSQARFDQLSLQQLQHLDAGQGQKIPLLEEMFALVQQQCQYNLELKGPNCTSLIVSHIREASQRYSLSFEDFIVSSFNHDWLMQVKALEPQIPLGLLSAAAHNYQLDFAQQALNAYSVHLDVNFVTPDMVAQSQKRGMKVYVYTVDKPDDIRDMLNFGVDGIFSNFPDRAKHHINKLLQRQN